MRKMKRMVVLWLGSLLLTGSVAYSAGKISLYVNGTAVKEAAVYVQNGQVYVPVRLVSEALGADVSWNASRKEVRIDGVTGGVWNDGTFPSLPSNLDAVNVVNRYMAALQGAFSGFYDADEDFKALLSRQALKEDSRVWHPISGLVGSSARAIVRYEIVDGRLAGEDADGRPIYEIAVRYSVHDPVDDAKYQLLTKAYTVIMERTDGKGLAYRIDRERLLSRKELKEEPKPFFFRSK
ncbi:copper amine oxidase N-terminal domain-containing protein [Paenibacillus cisolokensis]|uniref:stalk domain-containing protein n=1 Tax=Paenibacillus cisolokensis TaxID=1658519 RepID=UPI003D29EE75